MSLKEKMLTEFNGGSFIGFGFGMATYKIWGCYFTPFWLYFIVFFIVGFLIYLKVNWEAK